MKNRVNGLIKNKNHLYKGLDILDRQVFYKWALENKKFNLLFEEWEKEEYKLVKTPSIDRIDSKKGYVLENIQWLTFSENCSKGANSKKNKNG